MKARIGVCLVSLLSLLACSNRPESAIFGDLPDVSPAPGTGGSASSGSPATGGSASAAGNRSESTAGNGGTTSSMAGAGSASGSPASSAGAGGATEEPGVGGSGEEPPAEEPKATCGNGKVETGEQCDDGGQEGGDGCSAECQVVCSDFADDARTSKEFHCYAGFDEADFEGAVAACEQRGAHLVTIASQAENTLVNEFVQSSKWLGASDGSSPMSAGGGPYAWVTGEPLVFENWASQQPDGEDSRCNEYANYPRCYEHCAFMRGDGTWADARCDRSDGYVCEWEPAGE